MRHARALLALLLVAVVPAAPLARVASHLCARCSSHCPMHARDRLPCHGARPNGAPGLAIPTCHAHSSSPGAIEVGLLADAAPALAVRALVAPQPARPVVQSRADDAPDTPPPEQRMSLTLTWTPTNHNQPKETRS